MNEGMTHTSSNFAAIIPRSNIGRGSLSEVIFLQSLKQKCIEQRNKKVKTSAISSGLASSSL